MKKEKTLLKLSTKIIEQFENGEEMMMVKGGKGLLDRLWDLFLPTNINCTGNCNCTPTTNNNC